MPNIQIDAAMAGVVTNMKERTGRSLEEWVALVLGEVPDPINQKAVRAWLKNEHGVLQNGQWMIGFAVAEAAGWVEPSAAEYTDTQYQGARAHLRPIYEAAAAMILALGDDVSVEGRSTYTPFGRGRQFALLAPSTRTRVDLGLRFRDEAPHHLRLVPVKNLGQCTHRVELARVEDVTPDLAPLHLRAYEDNA